jgi:hypothetical protein
MSRKNTSKNKRTAMAKKAIEYPRETAGSRMAAKLRKQANSLTDEERERHFQSGMAVIYGGRQAAGARH